MIDDKHIKVLGTYKGETKQVGEIFTPGGSGECHQNAIQICGFDEAFDLWGCANYQTYKLKSNGTEYEYVKPESFSLPPSIIDAFDTDTREKLIQIARKDYVAECKRVQGKKIKIQLKDIQLKFPYPSESFKREEHFDLKDNYCWGCFNEPCTCENKGKHNYQSPYDVKRHSDLHLIEVKEEKKK